VGGMAGYRDINESMGEDQERKWTREGGEPDEKKRDPPAIKYSAHFSGEICSSDSSIFLVTAGFSFSSSTNPGVSIPAGMNK